MVWLTSISYALGGVFLANAVPHFVSGVMVHAFQSPFAKPPGQGRSSSTVNVLWAAFNLLVAYGLLLRVGSFDLRSPADAGAFGGGLLVTSLMLARAFGRLNGGAT